MGVLDLFDDDELANHIKRVSEAKPGEKYYALAAPVVKIIEEKFHRGENFDPLTDREKEILFQAFAATPYVMLIWKQSLMLTLERRREAESKESEKDSWWRFWS